MKATVVSELEQHFPHLIDKIVLLWGAPGFSSFLSNLIIDYRGNRHGFPPAVMDELLFLGAVDDVIYDVRRH